MLGKNIKKNKIILFAKYPELGKVKTRLAKDIGDQKALEIYSFLLSKTIKILSECTFAKNIVYISDPCLLEKFREIYPDFEVKAQTGGGLGERLINSLQNEWEPESRLLFIGADCPELNSDLIYEAFEKLDSVDIVIGPASDGGYYLIGVKNEYFELFQGIDWSTERVFRQTSKIAASLNLNIAILKILSDVDTQADLKKMNSIYLTEYKT